MLTTWPKLCGLPNVFVLLQLHDKGVDEVEIGDLDWENHFYGHFLHTGIGHGPTYCVKIVSTYLWPCYICVLVISIYMM